MSRYLAPTKIGLLALVELYAEGAVPNDAAIPVLNFITSQLLDASLASPQQNPAERWKKAETTIRLTVSVNHFEELLGSLTAADTLPGRRLWDRFLEKLWGIDSLHTLHNFFHRLPNLLARTKAELRELRELGEQPPSGVLFSRHSPFGFFVRKSHLEFSKLPFHQVAELWRTFVRYRQPTAAYWRRWNPHYTRYSFDAVLLEDQHEWGGQTDEVAVAAYGNMLLMGDEDVPLSVSTDDIESLLEFQIEQIQKYGNRVPPDVRDQFQKLLASSRTIIPSMSRYLSFSDSWRSGDFPGTFDDLHRYFDYTLQSRDRLFYQYALLNLGIVQSDFGCHKEAVATMLEAITTAKENRDTTCLNFALNWFAHLARSHPHLLQEEVVGESSSMLGSGGKEALVFLRAKAKETGLWILWISALLGEASLSLSSGESVSAAMESMVRSSRLIVVKNATTLIGPQLSLSAGLWDRLGLTVLSTMTCEVFHRCHARRSVLDDQLKLTCRAAGLLVGKGQYDDAFAKLEEGIDTNSLRSAKPDRYWRLYRGLVKLRRDLHHNNLASAEALLSQLLQHGPEDIDVEMRSTIDTLHIEALIRRQDFDAAFTKVERLMSGFRETTNTDVAKRIRLLLIKVHLFDRTGRPEKGFTLAMRAASMAWRARLLTLLWQALGALANILNCLGEFAGAERLLVALLPRCLETDEVDLAGTLYSLLADARIGLVGGEMKMKGKAHRGSASERAQLKLVMMGNVHKALDAAFRCFAAVEDVHKQCEVMAKKATLYKVEGDYVQADRCADTYLGLVAGGGAGEEIG